MIIENEYWKKYKIDCIYLTFINIMALVSYSKINIYEPDFDIISGLNIDKCPFIRNSRNNPMYKCLCNNQTFTNFSSFQSHIKLKTHEIWMVNCTDYFNELNSYKKEIERLSNENIKIPRKEIIEYDFVLRPLIDIAPDFIHPELNMSHSDIMKNHIIEKQIVKKVDFNI